MKLTAAILSLAVGTAVADDMTIRGDSKAASKLFKEARQLQNDNWYNNGNGYYYQNQGGGEENSWLGSYALKMLTCHQGETHYTGEGEPESSTVIFRLCPVDSCNPSGPYGCQQGYGDYTVGMQTFMEAFMEQKQEEMEQYQQYGGQYYGYNYGNQGNGGQGQNQYVYWDNYGEEFNVEEYMECRQYDMPDNGQYNYNGQYNNGGNYNYNGGYEVQYFIGPACSADGTSIRLALYQDEDCWYPSSEYFENISGGWTLPFSSGGLGSGECMACMGYDYELSKTCQELYENAGNRCEQNMQTYSYYGQNNYGCDYTTQMVQSVLGSYSSGSGTKKVQDSVSEAVEDLEQGRLSAKAISLIVVSAIVLACLSYCCFCLNWSSAAEREVSASEKGGVYYSADEETRPIS